MKLPPFWVRWPTGPWVYGRPSGISPNPLTIKSFYRIVSFTTPCRLSPCALPSFGSRRVRGVTLYNLNICYAFGVLCVEIDNR